MFHLVRRSDGFAKKSIWPGLGWRRSRGLQTGIVPRQFLSRRSPGAAQVTTQQNRQPIIIHFTRVCWHNLGNGNHISVPPIRELGWAFSALKSFTESKCTWFFRPTQNQLWNRFFNGKCRVVVCQKGPILSKHSCVQAIFQQKHSFITNVSKSEHLNTYTSMLAQMSSQKISFSRRGSVQLGTNTLYARFCALPRSSVGGSVSRRTFTVRAFNEPFHIKMYSTINSMTVLRGSLLWNCTTTKKFSNVLAAEFHATGWMGGNFFVSSLRLRKAKLRCHIETNICLSSLPQLIISQIIPSFIINQGKKGASCPESPRECGKERKWERRKSGSASCWVARLRRGVPEKNLVEERWSRVTSAHGEAQLPHMSQVWRGWEDLPQHRKSPRHLCAFLAFWAGLCWCSTSLFFTCFVSPWRSSQTPSIQGSPEGRSSPTNTL